MLATLLRPTDRGAEFGSGRSTLWFAARVAELTSVETNAHWHETVSNQLKERGVSNVEYILVPEDQPRETGDGPYAQVALGFPDASLDFALVDGYYRDYSAKYVMPKVKPGGILIIDNINWHLPSQSKAPGTRPAELGPATNAWAEVWQELDGWRRIWTSNGVWDTAIFFKPSN
jgi:predicted O-methyltransferase YrrM